MGGFHTARAILVANGALAPDAARRLVEDVNSLKGPLDLVIGVDGGARHLRALGIWPNVVTGDFDSLTPDELEEFKAHGADIVPTPDQDYTDLDKTIQWVLNKDAEKAVPILRGVYVYGGTGGRLDHQYSVLSTLIKHGRHPGVVVFLVDDVGVTWLPRPDADFVDLRGNDDLRGRTVSLMAFGTVTGITLTGVRWPLKNETLAPGVRDGTLNEINDAKVTLKVKSGDLLVMLHHAPAVTNGAATDV